MTEIVLDPIGKPDMPAHVLMKCGHTNTGITSEGKIVCASCYGIAEGADEVAEVQPDLTGRKAKCVYCKTVKDSSLDLPFFRYLPEEDKDKFYCGCYGWD